MSKIVCGYQIDIALGQNNLSTTFRAFKNNQTYLLKCFSKKELSHPLILSHFHHEAIEQEKLKNIPNVLHLVEKFQTQHNYYIVYEDCNDWMISQFVQKHGFLTENYALDLIKQIINAYQQLKKQNIQNRDISIHNILKHNNQIYIDDFGFDRLIQFQLLQQNQRQYQLYLAPELFLKNNQIDQSKVEAWSIGIILYYLLFKRYPYDTKNTLQMFKDIQNKAIFIPLNINNISIQCQNLLIKLLFANPSQRLSFNEILNHQVFQIQSENQNKMIQKVQQFSQDPENHWKKSMYMKFKPQIRAQQNKFSLSPTGQQNQTVKREQEKFLKIPNQVDNVKQIMRSNRDEIIKQNPQYKEFLQNYQQYNQNYLQEQQKQQEQITQQQFGHMQQSLNFEDKNRQIQSQNSQQNQQNIVNYNVNFNLSLNNKININQTNSQQLNQSQNFQIQNQNQTQNQTQTQTQNQTQNQNQNQNQSIQQQNLITNSNYPVFSNQNSNQNQSPSVFTNSSYSSNLYSQPQEPSVTNNVYQCQYQSNQIGTHKMNEEKQDNSPDIIKFSSYVPKNQNKAKFDLSDTNSKQNKISNQNLIPEIKNQSKISDYDSFIVIKSSDSDENQNQNPSIINFNDSQIPDIITNSTINNQKSNFITQTSLIREPAQQQKPENTVDSNQLKQEIDHLKNVTKKLDILGETLVEIDEIFSAQQNEWILQCFILAKMNYIKRIQLESILTKSKSNDEIIHLQQLKTYPPFQEFLSELINKNSEMLDSLIQIQVQLEKIYKRRKTPQKSNQEVNYMLQQINKNHYEEYQTIFFSYFLGYKSYLTQKLLPLSVSKDQNSYLQLLKHYAKVLDCFVISEMGAAQLTDGYFILDDYKIIQASGDLKKIQNYIKIKENLIQLYKNSYNL